MSRTNQQSKKSGRPPADAVASASHTATPPIPAPAGSVLVAFLPKFDIVTYPKDKDERKKDGIYEEEIGGSSYLARARKTGILYVIQRLSTPKPMDRESPEKFEKYTGLIRRNFEIAIRLEHPNIRKVEKVLSSEQYYYIVKQHIPEGLTVADVIATQSALKENDARRCFQQAVSGLLYYHRNGIAHGFINPHRLAIVRNPTNVFICDNVEFGHERAKNDRLSEKDPNTYWAPEVLLLRKRITPANDVWSLGCVLFEMITGKPAFHQGSLIDSNLSLLPEHPLITGDLKGLLEHMLKPNPSRRWTLEEVCKHPWFRVDLDTKLLEACRVSQELAKFRAEEERSAATESAPATTSVGTKELGLKREPAVATAGSVSAYVPILQRAALLQHVFKYIPGAPTPTPPESVSSTSSAANSTSAVTSFWLLKHVCQSWVDTFENYPSLQLGILETFSKALRKAVEIGNLRQIDTLVLMGANIDAATIQDYASNSVEKARGVDYLNRFFYFSQKLPHDISNPTRQSLQRRFLNLSIDFLRNPDDKLNLPIAADILAELGSLRACKEFIDDIHNFLGNRNVPTTDLLKLAEILVEHHRDPTKRREFLAHIDKLLGFQKATIAVTELTDLMAAESRRHEVRSSPEVFMSG